MSEQKELDITCHKIKLHTPTLKEMTPFPILLNTTCPWELDGQCGDCDKFMGMNVPDGILNAHTSYEGYCRKKVDVPKFKFEKGALTPTSYNLDSEDVECIYTILCGKPIKPEVHQKIKEDLFEHLKGVGIRAIPIKEDKHYE